jgi:Glycosyltransferase family 10 (fucosyltransferase) C-term/Fucosyltransferase, N-terminal
MASMAFFGNYASQPDSCSMSESEELSILIYQGMWDEVPAIPDDCGCAFWYDRSRWEEADAIVFHLPQLKLSRFPPRKRPGQFWVAWCMESETHYPMLGRRSELGAVFDLWMTYQRDSDIWCPYLNRNMIAALRAPPVEKTAARPAAAFISSPYDASGRRALLDALMREMPVDSYGRINRNRSLPPDAPLSAKQQILARYKFTLAFENAISRVYVTEKFFDPLLAGSVPIYLGAPNIEEFAPGFQCFIDASRFDSPQKLACYLLELDADPNAYARYLRWKSAPLRRSFLTMAQDADKAFARLAKHLRRLGASAYGDVPARLSEAST